MKRAICIAALLIFIFPVAASADDGKIKSAESAAIPSVASKATILDWNDQVLRKGTNGWTCLPDRDTPGNDPWCVNDAWMNFLDAYKNKKTPSYNQVGVAYMLQGDAPVSNTDPYASKPTADNDWVTDIGAHLMVLVPDASSFSSYPTDHKNGGPWVMWGGTPYAHLMIPLGKPGN